jgi:hypothetical protein
MRELRRAYASSTAKGNRRKFEHTQPGVHGISSSVCVDHASMLVKLRVHAELCAMNG